MAYLEKREEITLNTAQKIPDPTERRFAISALLAGFHVKPGIKIVSPQRVKDRKGRYQKTTTITDLTLVDENLVATVEVTSGKINTRQKQAQLRVVRRAHVSNYQQLSGRTIDLIEKIPEPSKKKFLQRFLKWK